MKTTPFWKDDAPRPADLPDSTIPTRVDVAVIGAGYTGLSAARTLAGQGASVAVLEQGQIGAGASAVNGGQTGPGLKKGVSALVKAYGQTLGHSLWRASVDAVSYMEQVIQEEQIDCDYHRSGSLALAHRPEHHQAQVRAAEWMLSELGYEFKVIPPETLREEIGSTVFFGGLLEPLGGGLHPAKFVYGLARAAARAGAMLCENSRVCDLEPVGGKFHLTTTQGKLTADQVLLATNGYTGPLAPRIQRYVFPVGSYMITTEPLPPELRQAVSPRNRVMYDTKRFLNYFSLTPDGRMSIGGRNNLSPDLDLVESGRNLHRRLLYIFPQLRDIPITHSWTGRLGLAFDLLPHIGQEEGIYYALGYAGHGVTLALYLGRAVAGLISGQSSDSPFAEIVPPSYFFYRGRAWFLPVAAAYYRLLDRIS